MPHGPAHGLHVLFLRPSGPSTKPLASQFWTQARQFRSATSHFRPWQAMNCGDKRAPVPARAPGWIISLCGTVKDGSAHANENVNQASTRPCTPSAAQGEAPCVPQSLLESPVQSIKQHRYSQGKTARAFWKPVWQERRCRCACKNSLWIRRCGAPGGWTACQTSVSGEGGWWSARSWANWSLRWFP